MSYRFTEEDKVILKKAQKENRDKNIDRRLKALLLRTEGKSRKDVSLITGYHEAYVTALVERYHKGGIDAITGNHYPGNHRNMTVEEEAKILEPFHNDAKAGKVIEVSAIKAAYESAVGHKVGASQIYYVLKRHGWRKVMPRSKHPQKATDEAVEASKKLTNALMNQNVM